MDFHIFLTHPIVLWLWRCLGSAIVYFLLIDEIILGMRDLPKSVQICYQSCRFQVLGSLRDFGLDFEGSDGSFWLDRVVPFASVFNGDLLDFVGLFQGVSLQNNLDGVALGGAGRDAHSSGGLADLLEVRGCRGGGGAGGVAVVVVGEVRMRTAAAGVFLGAIRMGTAGKRYN